jgi:hypothetical protein
MASQSTGIWPVSLAASNPRMFYPKWVSVILIMPLGLGKSSFTIFRKKEGPEDIEKSPACVLGRV